jgi:anti-sigma-K factor RskA
MNAVKHSPEIEELLSLYALGALDGDDLAALEAHLAAGCPECQAELARLGGDVEGLAASLPAVPPSEMTRARLLAKLPPAETSLRPSPGIAGPGRRGSRSGRGGWAWLAAAAVLLLVCGWGWLAARREAEALRAGRGGLARQATALGGELAAARAKSETLARELAAAQAENERVGRDFRSAQAKNELLTRDFGSTKAENERLVRDLRSAEAQSERLATAMAIISAPGMKPVALAALKAPPGAQGYAFVDPRSQKAVFVAANLPQLAPDRTYELWFIAGGKPVPAGTFGVDAGGRSGTVTVSGVADRVQAWAVTVEPRGGVPQPTGTMVLKG